MHRSFKGLIVGASLLGAVATLGLSGAVMASPVFARSQSRAAPPWLSFISKQSLAQWKLPFTTEAVEPSKYFRGTHQRAYEMWGNAKAGAVVSITYYSPSPVPITSVGALAHWTGIPYDQQLHTPFRLDAPLTHELAPVMPGIHIWYVDAGSALVGLAEWSVGGILTTVSINSMGTLSDAVTASELMETLPIRAYLAEYEWTVSSKN